MATGKSSKRSKATAIAAGGILGLGLWLGSQFDGFGVGGDGEGVGQTGDGELVDGETVVKIPVPGEEPDLELPEQTEPGMAPPVSEESAAATQEPMIPPDPQMIMVQIRADQYLVSVDGAKGRVATLEEIAELAESTTGDDRGVRLDIKYHETARGIDDRKLNEMLAKTSLDRTEIHREELGK